MFLYLLYSTPRRACIGCHGRLCAIRDINQDDTDDDDNDLNNNTLTFKFDGHVRPLNATGHTK